jgi:hypothetical protein
MAKVLKVKKSVSALDLQNDSIHERILELKVTVNKNNPAGAEKVITKHLGVSVFPKGVPLSSVRVRAHGTFNMGDYNSVQVSVEIEDVTLSNPEARRMLAENLFEEALIFNQKGIRRAAKALFNKDITGKEAEADGAENQ